MMKVKKYTVGT